MNQSTGNQFKRPAAYAGGRPEATALGEANAALIAELKADRDRSHALNAELAEQLKERQKQIAAGQLQNVAAASQVEQVLDQNKTVIEQNTQLTQSLRDVTASAAGIGAAAGQLAQAGGQQQIAHVPPNPVEDGAAKSTLEAEKHKAINDIVGGHVAQMKNAQTNINSARSIKAKLEILDIDCADPAVPLPQHCPNEVTACHQPKLFWPKEMSKSEDGEARLAGYQTEVDKKFREMQKAAVAMTIRIKTDIIAFYTAKRVKESAQAALVSDVTAFLDDTDISDAMKRKLTEGATAKFLDAREEEITKIELKKKHLVGVETEKHRVEEDARLQLLAETDGSTVAAVVREMIAEDKRATAAEDEVEMDLVELQKQNADIQKQLQNHPDFPGVPWTQKT
jgi:hypothetical protein